MPEIIEKFLLKRRIKHAGGDFSIVMSSKADADNVRAILKYATKKANAEQKKLVNAK